MDIKCTLLRFHCGSFGVVEPGAEGVGVAQFAAQMHGEFEFPAKWFDDAGGGDGVACAVGEGYFNVWAFLKGGDLQVYEQAASIGVGLDGEGCDARLFRNSAGEVVFGEEKFHVGDYTRLERGIGGWLGGGVGFGVWGVDGGRAEV